VVGARGFSVGCGQALLALVMKTKVPGIVVLRNYLRAVCEGFSLFDCEEFGGILVVRPVTGNELDH
jgi:hypothetical protein